MVVEVAGIAITTDSIGTAIDLALEASRRGLASRPTTIAETSTTMPSSTAWEKLIEYVTRPERHRQLRLLHALKARDGKHVSRDDLTADLGLTGGGANNKLGGVCTGVLKYANAVGLDATHVIRRSTLGYCAGPALLEHDLPEVRMTT